MTDTIQFDSHGIPHRVPDKPGKPIYKPVELPIGGSVPATFPFCTDPRGLIGLVPGKKHE